MFGIALEHRGQPWKHQIQAFPADSQSLLFAA
jgi:hypothetical protein